MQKYKDFQPTSFDSKENFVTWEEDGLTNIQEWFIVYSKNRDSDCLTDSNFDCALEILGGESETVEIHRFGHWACGWYELILLSPSRESEGQAIEDMLDNYSALDENDYSERQGHIACEYWQQMSVRERVESIQQQRNTYNEISVFAARRAEMPCGIDAYELIGQ